jgi:hypothetical protein
MANEKIRFSQKITGQERKVIAAVIAETAGGQVRYTGAPGFAYKTGGWSVDRASAVHSPEIGFDEISSVRPVIEALNLAGLAAEGNLTLELAAGESSEAAIENLKNLMSSKETLLKKSLGVDGELTITAGDGKVCLPFWNATLDAGEVQAYITLAYRLWEMAKTQKRISRTEKPADNEKYAFRCFLLRLGFIGDAFKAERKALLKRLTGNGAFKSGSKPERNTDEAEGIDE